MATFGEAAIRTFIHGVAGLTGSCITPEFRGTQAFTDGRTVVLPAAGLWEESDFCALCGIACHEISHVWFHSVDQLPRLLKEYPWEAGARVQRAMNAVMDVADETRFARAMPRAEHLFEAAREQVLHEAMAAGSIAAAPPANVPEDHLLAVAILWTRSRSQSAVARRLKNWRRNATGLGDVVSLLSKARERKGRSSSRFKPARTRRQWLKLLDLTRRLVQVLDRLYPPQPSHGAAGGSGVGEGDAPDASRDIATATDPIARWRQDASNAASRRAVAASQGRALPDTFEWEKAADRWQDGAILGQQGASRTRVGFRQDCYDQVWPAFRQVALALASDPTLLKESGFLSGGRLARPHRAAIDGRCFRRSSWEEGPEAAVALVFDQSNSMVACLDVFLPVGAALADALLAAPNVSIAIWRYGSEVQRLAKSAELRQGHTMGGTATHLVIREAAAWLASQSERQRTVILFTDGQPDDRQATADEIIRLRRNGATVLVGAIGLSELDCARTMPGAVVFSVDPREAGASLHTAAKRLHRDAWS
jgi:hypothetical protein